MKKLILPIIVALMAAVVFTSCSDEMTDNDLRNELQNAIFTGTDTDNLTYRLAFALSTFELQEPVQGQPPFVSTGTWNVTNGNVVLDVEYFGGYEAGWSITAEIQRDGRRIIFPIDETTSVTLNRQ